MRCAPPLERKDPGVVRYYSMCSGQSIQYLHVSVVRLPSRSLMRPFDGTLHHHHAEQDR